MSEPVFTLLPITHRDAERLRDRGGPVFVADAKPGYPCRQCLRDAEIGDELILVSHDPFHEHSPYRSASPIFLHRTDCGGPEHNTFGRHDALPDQLTCRQLSVRAFDAAEMMIDAAVVDGSDLSNTLDQMFTDPSTEEVHVHNASRGCWAVTVAQTTT